MSKSCTIQRKKKESLYLSTKLILYNKICVYHAFFTPRFTIIVQSELLFVCGLFGLRDWVRVLDVLCEYRGASECRRITCLGALEPIEPRRDTSAGNQSRPVEYWKTRSSRALLCFVQSASGEHVLERILDSGPRRVVLRAKPAHM